MMALFTLLLGLVIGWLAKHLLDQFLEQGNNEHEPPPDDIHASVKHWLRQNNQLKTQLKQQTAINANSTRQLQQQALELDNFAEELHQRSTAIHAYKKTLAIKLEEMAKLQARQTRYDDTTSKLRQQLHQREQALLQQQTEYHTAVTQFKKDQHEQQTAIDALKAQIQLTRTINKKPSVHTTPPQTVLPDNKKTTPDDLTRIKGIGPKLAATFHKNDVRSFNALAETSPTTIRAWLDATGSRFKLTTDHDITDWLAQATLAAEQRWDELDAFGKQSTLASTNTPTHSNLTKIWGVGKKLETLLNELGIYTYQQLMSASPDELTALIEASHSYYPDSDNATIFNAWQHQAELADHQQWGQLRGYQQHYRDLRSQHSKSASAEHRRGISLKSELSQESNQQPTA